MGGFSNDCGDTAILEDIKQSCVDRIKGRSFAFHKSSTVLFADLAAAELGANWDIAEAAETVNILPQLVVNLAITDSTPLTEGTEGGYDTPEGVLEVTGQTKPQLTGGIYQMNAANNVKLNALNSISQNAGVSVFILDPESNVIWGYLNSDGSVQGFPIIRKTFYISVGGSEAGAQQIKTIQGSLPADYDEKKISFSLDDRTVREMLNAQAV